MKMEEKIEKVLKDYLQESQSWKFGFRIGFRHGYLIALEESTKMLKEIREKLGES